MRELWMVRVHDESTETEDVVGAEKGESKIDRLG